LEHVAPRMNTEGAAISLSQMWRISDGLDLESWQTGGRL
jgi:hypothetical protein